MTQELDEREIISASLKGDREAFRVLVEKYQTKILRLVLQIVYSKEDAEDIVQESFVKAYLSLESFRGESSFYTWIYRIAFNMAIDFKRKVARRGGDAFELSDIESGKAVPSNINSDLPIDTVYRKEQSSLINKALNSLSEEHRTVIVLREIDGLSYDDIAQITGATLGTVMSRLHYARKKLQSALDEIKPFTEQEADRIVPDVKRSFFAVTRFV